MDTATNNLLKFSPMLSSGLEMEACGPILVSIFFGLLATSPIVQAVSFFDPIDG